MHVVFQSFVRLLQVLEEKLREQPVAWDSLDDDFMLEVLGATLYCSISFVRCVSI